MQNGHYKKLAGALSWQAWVTLQFISSYLNTWLVDTRIGYPNEQLASSVIEEVKSQMYATS